MENRLRRLRFCAMFIASTAFSGEHHSSSTEDLEKIESRRLTSLNKIERNTRMQSRNATFSGSLRRTSLAAVATSRRRSPQTS
ncbi:uncharacterized protein G2W53_041466 [Senna tora]|uniref:Uncharacterized protein n=1 Tax=Senna tora TaxID=362788 RepID=A0A834VZ74_9FABA|nr:uncharacterized protein G2W53_041466 [Senna tora]